MPSAWAAKAELRSLPAESGMEPESAFWIDELSAWIAADEEEAAIIREAIGAEARIIMAKDLP